jgi:UDP-glucose 4-epimerase
VHYEGSTPGDQFGITGSFISINNDIGWEPYVSLTDGLSNMVKWAINIK